MTDTLLTLLGAVSVFANRVSEAVKSALHAKYPDMAPETVSAVALFTSLIAGIVGALVLNINLLMLLPPSPYTANIPPLAGVILAGCVASFGSEGLHWLLDLLHARRDEMATPTASATVTLESGTTGGQTVTASASSDSTPPAPLPQHGAARPLTGDEMMNRRS